MELATIQRISSWATVIVLFIACFVGGSYATCKMSDGTLLPDLKCVEMDRLSYCVFEEKIYKYNTPPIDLNLTLNNGVLDELQKS